MQTAVRGYLDFVCDVTDAVRKKGNNLDFCTEHDKDRFFKFTQIFHNWLIDCNMNSSVYECNDFVLPLVIEHEVGVKIAWVDRFDDTLSFSISKDKIEIRYCNDGHTFSYIVNTLIDRSALTISSDFDLRSVLRDFIYQ